MQKDPYNIEFAGSVREARRNKSTRMSSSSEHVLIDSLLAFEAKATHKKTLDRWRACNDRRSAHFEEQHGEDTPRRNTPRLRARVRQDAQRSAKNAYKSRPAAQWPMPQLNAISSGQVCCSINDINWFRLGLGSTNCVSNVFAFAIYSYS